MRRKTFCNEPGCCAVIDVGSGGKCEKHKKIHHKKYNYDRWDNDEQTFYKTSQWKKVRELKLSMNPICERCLKEGKYTVAKVVHHIVEIKDGGSRTGLFNLESVCYSCHRKYHSV